MEAGEIRRIDGLSDCDGEFKRSPESFRQFHIIGTGDQGGYQALCRNEDSLALEDRFMSDQRLGKYAGDIRSHGENFRGVDTFIGPPRTINYVWADQMKTNSTFDHPSSSRSKFIVVENGNEKSGQWLMEQRDLKKDWEMLFKDKSMPKIVGVGVFTDSDGTHTAVTGWYDDMVIEGK